MKRADLMLSIPLSISLAVLLLFLSVQPLYAVEVRAEVERDTVEEGEEVILRVIVEGVTSGASPILPPLPDWTVSSRGTSSSFQITNGRVTSSLIYTYSLYPHRTGELEIGPIEVRIKGRVHKTEPIKVTVRGGGIKRYYERTPDEEEEGEEKPEEQDIEEPPPIFVTAHVTNDSPYFREPILYIFRFFRAVTAMNPRLEKPPFEGFTVLDLGKRGERNYIKNIRSIRYDVTEIVIPLIPSEIRNITIPQATLTVEVQEKRKGRSRSLFDDFFNDPFFSDPFFGHGITRTRILKTKDIDVKVRPFIEKGKPEGFNNLVGSFGIQADINKRELEVGDSATLTIEVAGVGNILDATIPEFEIKGAKIYNDRGEEEFGVVGEKFRGRKVFKKAIVPYQEGVIRIPEITLVFFEPISKTYKSVSTTPFSITVTRGKGDMQMARLGEGGRNARKVDIEVKGNDILPIYTGKRGLRRHLIAPLSPFILISIFSPPLVFFSLVAFRKRQEELERNIHVVKRKRAGSELNRGLKTLHRLMARGGEREALSKLSSFFKDFIGKRMGIEGGSLTPSEIETILVESKVPREIKDEVVAILRGIEEGLFGMKSKVDVDLVGLFVKRVKRVSRNLLKYI